MCVLANKNPRCVSRRKVDCRFFPGNSPIRPFKEDQTDITGDKLGALDLVEIKSTILFTRGIGTSNQARLNLPRGNIRFLDISYIEQS